MDTLHRPLSYRQKQAVEIWIAGGRRSKARALREAGFSEAVARVPSKVFDSPAVQRELELRGLSRDGLSNCEQPRAEMTEVVYKTALYDFDPFALSIEQCQELKARLAEVGGDNPFMRKQVEIPSRPLQDDSLRTIPYGDTKYQNLSSM